jgi:hypothetical protein
MTISRSRPQPDILIRDDQGYPVAAVDVRNPQNLTRDVATEIGRNLLAYGLPIRVPYFLMVSQDVGFLWKQPRQENPDALPDYKFPMNKVVSRYRKLNPEERLYGEVLKLIVLQWLTDLAEKPQKETEEPEKTLALAGFIESIREATVLAEEEL